VAILSGNRRARRHGAQPGYAGEGRNGERNAPAGGGRSYAACLVVNRFHYSVVPYQGRPVAAGIGAPFGGPAHSSEKKQKGKCRILTGSARTSVQKNNGVASRVCALRHHRKMLALLQASCVMQSIGDPPRAFIRMPKLSVKCRSAVSRQADSHRWCDRPHRPSRADVFAATGIAYISISCVNGAWISLKAKRTRTINKTHSARCAAVTIKAMFPLKAIAVSILNTRDKEA
jgi:hypothetical protein